MKAVLILEDGTEFPGVAIGARKEVISEIVFNTSMSGYLEVITDPSYAGQSVVMTYPLIGNYGVSRGDMESAGPAADALIVREISRVPSNWRLDNTLQGFLEKYRMPGIMGVDTRSLVIHLREKGTMNGCITTREYRGAEREALLERIRAYRVQGKVAERTVPAAVKREPLAPFKTHVALLDLGCKEAIIRSLLQRGCRVTVFPAFASAAEILSVHPDGILISNGPGDPAENTRILPELRTLMDAGLPILAICLGHQLMALAAGGRTYKLKFGHRGGNHPVKDLATGRVYISAQNHGYAVDASSMDPAVAVESFRNVNDGTNEGFRYPGRDIVTVQFHPESRPGPQDLAFLFDDFVERMVRSHAG